MDVVNQINGIKPNNIEYGFVAAANEDWIEYHSYFDRKLLYVSTNTNGVNTASTDAEAENYFGFAKNVNCTSRRINKSNPELVKNDHQNFSGYLLYSLVITYEEEGSDHDKDVLARPYIKYTDANGLPRVAYSEYRGNSNTLGGCRTNYSAVLRSQAGGN